MDQVMASIAAKVVLVLYAAVILVVGWWVAKLIRDILARVMRRREVEPGVISFTANVVYVGLVAFVIIAALNKIGIQTASFVVVLGAAGLAIGLALQGSLSNFAAGALLVIFKPLRVGDYVEAGGTAGVVEAIEIFTTTLKTPDNKTVILPNAQVTGGAIVNYSTQGTRRLDLVVGVSYSDDMSKVRKILQGILRKDKRVLKEPEPAIAVLELADSSVNFAVRPWVASENYWPLRFDLTEEIKRRFDEEGVSIPFPQRDVHMIQSEAAG